MGSRARGPACGCGAGPGVDGGEARGSGGRLGEGGGDGRAGGRKALRAGLRRRNAGHGGLAVPKLDVFNGARRYVVDEGIAEKSPSPHTRTELHQTQAGAATTRSPSTGGRPLSRRRLCWESWRPQRGRLGPNARPPTGAGRSGRRGRGAGQTSDGKQTQTRTRRGRGRGGELDSHLARLQTRCPPITPPEAHPSRPSSDINKGPVIH